MTQRWYEKVTGQAAIAGGVLVLSVGTFVSHLDELAAPHSRVIRSAPAKDPRPGFGAALVPDTHFAALQLTIWNNTDNLVIAENLVLNWKFRRCGVVVSKEVPGTVRLPEFQSKLLLEYTGKVILPAGNGAAQLSFKDASDAVSRGPYQYAKGEVDYFWIVLKPPKFPDPLVGQKYDLWVTFDYRQSSENGSRQFRTEPITRGSCTRVVLK